MSEARAAYEIRINEVINFVEAHYGDRLLLGQLADVAHFSPFHFHRIFSAFTGETPHAYLTRIRLEKAIAMMERGGRSLTEVAFECGFASGSDFSRSFKQQYGFSPKDYSRDRMLKESKIRQELLSNAGYASPMNSDAVADGFRVTVADQPAMRIAYIRVIGGYKPDRILSGLERLLAWSRANGFYPGNKLIGRSKDNPETTPKSKYRYDWCMEIPEDFKPDPEVSYGRIPAHRVAVLHCMGDIRKVYRAWTYLYRDWLPDSGYQPADEAAMEVFHGEHELTAETTFNLDCCIPIEPLSNR